MKMIEAAILLLFLLLVFFGLRSILRPPNGPPGPLGLPFVGSMHLLGGDFSKNLLKLAKTYGNIYRLKMGSNDIVCIIGLKLYKEVMVENAPKNSGRPNTFLQTILRDETHEGVVISQYGLKLVAHRKLFHSVLRSMGLGRKDLGKLIVEELPYFIEELQSYVSKTDAAVDPSAAINYASLNVLAYFIFGNRYAYKDEKFKALLENNYRVFNLIAKTNTVGFSFVSLVPYLHKIWLPKTAIEIQGCIRNVMEFIKSEVEYHKSTLDSNNPRDLIDYYLMEISKQTSDHFTETGLQMSILDFFQAGTETTSTTIKWAMIYMVNNPRIQEKVQAEIDNVLGCDQLPSYEDRLKMPYTEATIMEVQRRSCITPVGILHATSDSTKVAGYDVPKGSILVPCYQSFLHSSEHWKNPNQFDPENFLDADGKLGTRPAFLPFGAGLRVCLGMNIAKPELFLFFVAMLQHFQLQPSSGVLKVSEEYIPGLTLQPKPFKIIIKNRL